MTVVLFVLAAVCAVNAPRAIGAVPDGASGWFAFAPDTGTTPRAGLARSAVASATLGAALALGALVPVAGFSGPLLDLLDVSAPTVRIAVGVLLVVQAIVVFGWRAVKPQPALPGRWAALVPVAFPTLLTPGLVLLTLSGAADLGVVPALVGATVALSTLPLIALALSRPRSLATFPIQGGLALLLNGGLILCGFALLFDGVFDI